MLQWLSGVLRWPLLLQLGVALVAVPAGARHHQSLHCVPLAASRQLTPPHPPPPLAQAWR